MIDDEAKEAAAAREAMHSALTDCANVLQALAMALTATTIELAQATEREQAATLSYISALERELHQRALN